MAKSAKNSQHFKEDAVPFRLNHQELQLRNVA